MRPTYENKIDWLKKWDKQPQYLLFALHGQISRFLPRSIEELARALFPKLPRANVSFTGSFESKNATGKLKLPRVVLRLPVAFF